MSDTPPQPIGPPGAREDAIAVVRRLHDAGHVAYFAGGCVRDALLGLEPKDYVVATDAPPPRVRGLFPRTQAVGAAFGVIIVWQGDSQIEVATFRADLDYVDGRRPEGVVFTTAEEDAKRRDFTINGLFFDPLEQKVIDYVGGQADLKSRTLRAIGNPGERFAEDHLRLLRAVRFAARFGLTIDPATADAIRQHAEHLKCISPERIAEELRLMLTPPGRVSAWQVLWEFGLLQVILRFLPERSDRPDEDRSAKAIFPQLGPGTSVPFGLALAGVVLGYRLSGTAARSAAALTTPAEAGRAVQACQKALKISNEEADQMAASLSLSFLLADEPPSVARMKRFLSGRYAAEARSVLDALERSDFSLSSRIGWLKTQFAAFDETDVAPPPLITGDDLTAAGLVPGRVFKAALDATYDAQLEGRVSTREQALEMGLRIAQDV